MSRERRDRDSERTAIQQASARLLSGRPAHSRSGRLTVTELITESRLRRDVVYDHTDLVDAFKLDVRARATAPISTLGDFETLVASGIGLDRQPNKSGPSHGP